MAKTAADAVALSDSDIDELVDDATSDITGTDSAPDSDNEPARPAASDVATDDLDESVETEEGEEEDDTEPQTPAPVAGAKPGQPPAGPAPAEQPFRFKASGAQHVFNGATELPTGELKFSKEAGNQLRTVLASRVEEQKRARQERADFTRKVQALEKDRSDKEIEADLVIGLFQNIRKMTPEDRWKWANELEQKAPQLELAIEKEKIARDRERWEREKNGPELTDEEISEEFTRTVQKEVHATFTRLLSLPEARFLPNEDRKEMWEKWIRRGHKLVAKEGENLVFDDTDIAEEFQTRVKLRQQSGKLATAAQRNAAMNADQRGTRIPPVVRGGKPPTTQPGKKKDFRGQRKSYKNEFMSGKLDRE